MFECDVEVSILIDMIFVGDVDLTHIIECIVDMVLVCNGVSHPLLYVKTMKSWSLAQPIGMECQVGENQVQTDVMPQVNSLNAERVIPR